MWKRPHRWTISRTAPSACWASEREQRRAEARREQSMGTPVREPTAGAEILWPVNSSITDSAARRVHDTHRHAGTDRDLEWHPTLREVQHRRCDPGVL